MTTLSTLYIESNHKSNARLNNIINHVKLSLSLFVVEIFSIDITIETKCDQSSQIVLKHKYFNKVYDM